MIGIKKVERRKEPDTFRETQLLNIYTIDIKIQIFNPVYKNVFRIKKE